MSGPRPRAGNGPAPPPAARPAGRRRGGPRPRHERGSGTVLAVLLVLVLLAALAAVAVLGRAVHARGVARTAADLGALTGAAALHSPVPAGDPCGAAARVAGAQGAAVAGCRVEGATVLVTASAPVDLGAFGVREAVAAARAGPAG